MLEAISLRTTSYKSLTHHHVLSSGLLVASSNTLAFTPSLVKPKDELEDVMQDIVLYE